MLRRKRLLSLLLCLVMVLSFFPTALAEGEGDGVILDEHNHEGEDQGMIAPVNEEPVGAIQESLDEEPAEEPVGADAPGGPEDNETGDLVRVEFICDPEDTVITVYDPAKLNDEGEPEEILPEVDGSWLLVPGEYLYDAHCDGYWDVVEETFEIDQVSPTSVVVQLIPIEYSYVDCSDLMESQEYERVGTIGSQTATGGVRTKLDAVLAQYPDGSYWKDTFDGAKQCYGFAGLVVYNVFGKSTVSGKTYRWWTYAGKSTSGMKLVDQVTTCTEANVKAMLEKARPGDVLQFDAGSNGHQHSMIVYEILYSGSTVTGARIYECNWYGSSGSCQVTLRSLTNADIAKRQTRSDGTKRGKLSLLTSDNWVSVNGGEYAGPTPTGASRLSLTGATYPSGHYDSLSSFGLRGVFSSNYTIIRVNAYVKNAAGTKVLSYEVSWNKTTYDIQSDGLNNKFTFGSLDKGSYTYFVEATDSYGKTVSASSTFDIGSPTTYTITYNANGGTGAPGNQTKTHGVTLTLSDTEPVREGYSFLGWAKSKNTENAEWEAGDSYTEEGNATLYAVWKVNKLYVRYHANGGTVGENDREFHLNDDGLIYRGNYEFPNVFEYGTVYEYGLMNDTSFALTCTGHSFVGWSLTSDGSSTIFDQDAILKAEEICPELATGDRIITLYAIWAADTYTVSYDANGGTGAPAAQSKTYGTALTLSSTKPTRANASAGSFTVTLDPNGGSVSTYKLTAERTTSYTFKDWNTAQNGSGTSYDPGASYTANATATLYAQWNSSTTTAAVTLPTPTRTGYTFKGWATSASATSGTTGSYTPTGNVTLYAIWKQDQTTEGTLSLGTVRGSAGSEVVLEVKLDKNPGIMMLSFRLDYDKSKLQYLGGEDGSLTGWTFSTTGSGALWDGDKDYKATGTIVKLRFKILDNAKEGDVVVNFTAVEAWNYSEREILFGANAGKVTISNRIPGDVTGDGKVNGMDLVRLRKYLAGDSVEIDLSNADVTGDGKVNGMDLIRLRKYLAGEAVELK